MPEVCQGNKKATRVLFMTQLILYLKDSTFIFSHAAAHTYLITGMPVIKVLRLPLNGDLTFYC